MMSGRHRWLFTLLIVQQCLWRMSFACPTSCKCKWKGGKQTVECINENLITIPDGMDQGTQVLDFSGNNLQILPRERFQRMGLLHLQRIYLTRCRISHIDSHAFRGLTNLVELDLSENLLANVPSDTFSDYPSLMRLTFSGNPLRTLKSNAFRHLSYLTTLELSKCELETIEEDSFVGLDSLEWLKLDGNRLTGIKGAHVLPESLHGINLHNNPWQCDCRLLEMRTWLLNYNFPHSIEPKCIAPPRLKDVAIKSLDESDLACLPDVTPTTLYLEIGEGKNISLLCRVSAIPEATVSWWFQGRILQNDSIIAPGLHLYYFIEEGVEEKKSELFIFNTNTDDNGTFVCIAENPAGKSQSNYTIRIVVKEETVVGISAFPYEYVITIVAATAVFAFFIVVAIVVCIIRCHRQRIRKRKKERSKVVALQNQQQAHGKPTHVGNQGNQITMVGMEISSGQPKVNGIVVMSERYQNQMIMVSTGSGGGLLGGNFNPSGIVDTSYGSPRSLRNYSLEQNPDLINDTESVGKERRKGKMEGNSEEDGERENSGPNSYQEAMENIIHDYETNPKSSMSTSGSALSIGHQLIDQQYPIHMNTLPRGCRDVLFQRHHTADVHLSPGRFLDTDGYPMDYGLPKVPTLIPLPTPIVPTQTPTAFYRTLPHHRPARLETAGSAATPCSRYTREAEFLSRSAQPPSYEHYSPADVRYTVEGYPRPPKNLSSTTSITYSLDSHGSFPDSSYLPSPPAPYKSESTSTTSSAITSSTVSTSTSPPKEIQTGWPRNLSAPIQSMMVETTVKKTSSQETTSTAYFSNNTSGDSLPSSLNDSKSKVERESPGKPESHGTSTTIVGPETSRGDASVKRVAPSISNNAIHQLQAILTESPDEGYEGEGGEI